MHSANSSFEMLQLCEFSSEMQKLCVSEAMLHVLKCLQEQKCRNRLCSLCVVAGVIEHVSILFNLSDPAAVGSRH